MLRIGSRLLLALGSLVLGIASPALGAPINPVAYGSLTGTGLIDFDDVPAAPLPGVSIEGVLDLDGASFAERFAGQTLGVGGFGPFSDTVSGSPTDPLTLVAGAPGENLVAADLGGIIGIAGLGPVGFPDADANGEGAVAILFDEDTAEVGIEILGVDAASVGAIFQFFRRDGTLIDTVTVPLPVASLFVGFERELGTVDIAGVVITNDDLGGIGYDNLVFQQAVPEPSTGLLVAGTLLLLTTFPRVGRAPGAESS